jgi:HD-GYP domain-containing protein (c-di-GMP phosphodiesterase class II)
MTLDMAIDEIKRCSSTQFDPEVVEALVLAAGKGDLTLLPRASGLPAHARV